MSINKEKLQNILIQTLESKRYKKSFCDKVWNDIIDFDLIYYLISTILDRNPLDNVKYIGNPQDREGLPLNKTMAYTPKNCGLIIGDVISQLFSNIYLNMFDHFVKRVLKCKHYGRYVDDAYIINEDKKYLQSILPLISDFLEKNLFLKLNYKKTKIINVKQDILFLGASLRPFRKYPSNRTLKSFKNKINLIERDIYNKKIITKEDLIIYRATINSYLGYLKHYKTYKYKKKILKDSILNKYFYFLRAYNKAIINPYYV